ncbi:uncharacterized protein LOC103024733 isoform X2 [Astyanax mexicanus]|uniref:uncharacterized protein LOC103024733 isoform X2 n=1 Tax=Astyanax mexicanus TaxID=7994 RepID=UPI0020CB23CB|nr:uncharacterized protein LOC103024733 isoform X2 [Astyanax mexicanus]
MWFRGSQPLQPLTPEDTNTNTLSITASDTAEYQCSALRGENFNTDLSDPVKITVKTGPLNIGLAVGSSLFILIIIILGLFWCYKKNKGGGNPGLPANQQNTSQKQNVAGPGDSVSIPLQSDDSATQPSDVTYAQVTTTIKKPRRNVTSSNDVTYSEIAMKNMKHQNKGEPSDVTYAEIDLKPKEKKASKGKTTADTDQETIYSKLK